MKENNTNRSFSFFKGFYKYSPLFYKGLDESRNKKKVRGTFVEN